jgi:hypothetical protein
MVKVNENICKMICGCENQIYLIASVAEPEPEPVEWPLFGGAGAQAFRPGSSSGSGYVNSYKMLQKALNFSSKN